MTPSTALQAPFDTARLTIRPMTLADADFAAALWGDPRVGRYLADRVYIDGDDLRRDIADMDTWENEYMFIACDRATGRDIGTCSVGQEGEPGRWGWGYCVHPDCWGRGYATEIARAMMDFALSRGIHCFQGTVAAEHAASCRVMEKLGLRLHGQSTFTKRGTDLRYVSNIYRLDLSPEPTGDSEETGRPTFRKETP